MWICIRVSLSSHSLSHISNQTSKRPLKHLIPWVRPWLFQSAKAFIHLPRPYSGPTHMHWGPPAWPPWVIIKFWDQCIGKHPSRWNWVSCGFWKCICIWICIWICIGIWIWIYIWICICTLYLYFGNYPPIWLIWVKPCAFWQKRQLAHVKHIQVWILKICICVNLYLNLGILNLGILYFGNHPSSWLIWVKPSRSCTFCQKRQLSQVEVHPTHSYQTEKYEIWFEYYIYIHRNITLTV